jgi:putative transposase
MSKIMRVITMPRRAREKSKSGIYHIILRGANRREIFHDDEDYMRFLETLEKYKKKTEIKIYGWCLMGNHIHLLLEEGKMKALLPSPGFSIVHYLPQ